MRVCVYIYITLNTSSTIRTRLFVLYYISSYAWRLFGTSIIFHYNVELSLPIKIKPKFFSKMLYNLGFLIACFLAATLIPNSF